MVSAPSHAVPPAKPHRSLPHFRHLHLNTILSLHPIAVKMFAARQAFNQAQRRAFSASARQVYLHHHPQLLLLGEHLL